jgi:hypothetical protein
LTKIEWKELITNCDKFPVNLRHYPSIPLAFTEQGVAMLSGVLKSKRAILVNIAIMRAFVNLRQMIDTNRELTKRIDAMEEKYDEQFKHVFEAIRELIGIKRQPMKKIGYRLGKSEDQ